MRDVKLRLPEVVFLFVLGGVAALIGDHSHVTSATTVYYTDAVPFVGSSPFWFPLLVGAATVSLAELRLHLPQIRTTVTVRQGIAGVAAVVGMYVTTALLHGAPVTPATTLICVAAVLTWCVLGDGPAAICGAIAAIVGPVAEVGLMEMGVFAYNPGSDHLFGVGAFLVPLYFAFGVVVATFAELLAARRQGQAELTEAVSGPGAG